MTTSHFKNAAKTLNTAAGNAGVFLSVYDLLNLTEALIDLGAVFDENYTQSLTDHDKRVMAALTSPEVMKHMRDGKKIHAIKELRLITQCGLKEAKDAVEDDRVADCAGVFRVQRY